MKKKKQLLKAGAVMAAGLAGSTMMSAADIPAQQPAEAPVQVTAADAVVINGEVVDYDQLMASMPTPAPVDQYKKMYGPPQKLVYGPPPAPPKRIDNVITPEDSVLMETQVIALVAQFFHKESEKSTRESNFYQDLGAELNYVENVMRLLDQEWETDTYYKAENVQTVGDVIDILLTNRRHSRRGEDPLR